LGIEALSRGAGHVNFVEADPKAARVIGLNLEKTRLADRPHEVHTMDVFRFLDRFAEQGSFELVLADPPYAKAKGDVDWNGRLLGDAVLPGLLAPGGWFLLESFARGGAGAVAGSRWELRDERRYGDALIGYYQLKPDSAHAALDDTAGV
jgi:16S rRNA G966 N2-methylase RsmD